MRSAPEAGGVDYPDFECPHSGHGLQNDNAVYRQRMQTARAYLEEYRPVD